MIERDKAIKRIKEELGEIPDIEEYSDLTVKIIFKLLTEKTTVTEEDIEWTKDMST